MTVKKVLVCDVCESNGVVDQDFHERIAVERISLRFSSGGTKTTDVCGAHLQKILDLIGTKPESRVDNGDGFKCPVCDREFGSRSGVRYHMSAEHGDQTGVGSKGRTKRTQPMPCPFCDKTPTGPQGLSAHIRGAHPEYEEVEVSAEGVIVNGRKVRPHKGSAAAAAAAE